ncbi:hypothetical protein Bbelb_009340 [Branchiostoma belcheri]|nr:hypothetical protein Bbelb_009340 [Branchiostoma belcheri]
MSYPGGYGGYPPQGYPPAAPGGYPPANPYGGPPPSSGPPPPPGQSFAGGAVPPGGYPPAGGYPYPPSGGGYPPSGGGYPPASGGYPPAPGGYPPSSGGYPSYPTGNAGPPPPGAAVPGFTAPGMPQPPGQDYSQGMPGQYPQGGQPGYQQSGYQQPPAAGGYPQAPPAGGYPQAPAAGGGYPQAPASGGYQQPPAPSNIYSGGDQPPPQPAAQPKPQEIPEDPFEGEELPRTPTDDEPPEEPFAGEEIPQTPTEDEPPEEPFAGEEIPQTPTDDEPPEDPFAGEELPQTPTDDAPPPQPVPPTHELSQLSLGGPGETHGTVVAAANFDAEEDAKILRKAMKGMGTDEKAILELLAERSNAQRQKIKLQFKTMYGKDLIQDLKSELSGDFKESVMALFVPTTEYDAWCLNNAMVGLGRNEEVLIKILCTHKYVAMYIRHLAGLGTNEEVLIEILCTRTNEEIAEIVRVYREKFKRDLEKDVVGDTSGHFKRLLVSMTTANRDEVKEVDYEKAVKEAKELYKAGEKKWGTDESEFNRILACRSFPQLKATFDEYIKVSQRDIMGTIDREFSGHVRDGMKAIVQCVRNRPEFFADKIHKCVKGLGTDDHTLIRVIVTRSEYDMVEIKQVFLNKYRKTVWKAIESDTSGDYKRILQALVKKN